jgi:hypothetical protein
MNRAALAGATTLGLGTLLLVTPACDKSAKEPTASAEESSATAANTAAVLNPEIARAVAAAASGDKPQAAADGPPPDGLLTAARADSEATIEGGAKVVLGGTGTDPKVQLGGPEVTDKCSGQLELSVRTGPRSALPTVAFKFGLVGKTPEVGPHEVTVDVLGSSLAANQPGQIPEELGAALAKLKGSKFHYSSTGGRLSSSPSFELAKGAAPDMDLVLMTAADVLSSALLSFPAEPMGKDGFWMTTSREKVLGTDVVAYRMVRVVDVTERGVELDVKTRRYAAEPTLGMPGIGAHSLKQFQAEDSTTLLISPGHRLPVEGRAEITIGAVIESAQGQAPVQIQIDGSFGFPPKGAQSQSKTTSP